MSVRPDDLPDFKLCRTTRKHTVPLRDAFQAADLTADDLEAIARYFDHEALATRRHRIWGNGRRRSVRSFATRASSRKLKGGR